MYVCWLWHTCQKFGAYHVINTPSFRRYMYHCHANIICHTIFFWVQEGLCSNRHKMKKMFGSFTATNGSYFDIIFIPFDYSNRHIWSVYIINYIPNTFSKRHIISKGAVSFYVHLELCLNNGTIRQMPKRYVMDMVMFDEPGMLSIYLCNHAGRFDIEKDKRYACSSMW